jgi:hypothetical protein
MLACIQDPAMEATVQKRRQYPRHKAPKGMRVGWRASARRGVSQAEVVGLGGIFLQTPNPLPAGTMMELLFDLKTGEVRARAIVRTSTPGKGMGVQFVQMQPVDRGRLNQFLLQYSAPEDGSAKSSG